MMERILSDFVRRRRGMLIKCVIISAAMWAAAWIPMIFSGGWSEWLRWVWGIAAAVLSAAVAVLLIRAFAEITGVAPSRLRSQLSAIPEKERSEIFEAYPNAKSLGERWFLPEHILFYTNRRAVILRYDAIKTVSPKKDGDLLLVTSQGDITMPVKDGENGGIIYAVLRSRNPDIKSDFGDAEKNTEKETERT